jgi:predicted transcriptional regulator of viral defense system
MPQSTPSRHGIAPLDRRLAEGKATLTSAELREELDLSAQATSNLLARWQRAGLVDRVARGRYAIRQIGLLGTSASSEDVALAVAALVGDRPHRIAYHSALDFHGLLTRPVRTVHLACPHRIASRWIGDLPLKVVREPVATVRLGGEEAGHGARVSNVERALLDAASRPDLVGGYFGLAEALATAQPDRDRLVELARDLNASAALRRIGSLADRLEVSGLANEIELPDQPTFDLDLDPTLKQSDTAFRDRKWRVRWPVHPAAAIEEISR